MSATPLVLLLTLRASCPSARRGGGREGGAKRSVGNAVANGNILSGLGVGQRNRRPRRVVGRGRGAVTLKVGAVFSTKQARPQLEEKNGVGARGETQRLRFP